MNEMVCGFNDGVINAEEPRSAENTAPTELEQRRRCSRRRSAPYHISRAEVHAERVNDFETATAVLLVERLRGDERVGFPNRVEPQVVRGDDRRSWGILGSRFLEGRVDPYSLG